MSLLRGAPKHHTEDGDCTVDFLVLPSALFLCSFVGALGSLPLPDSSCAPQHLLLFISALIPKALASLLTTFSLVLAGDEQVHQAHLNIFIFKRN